MPHPRTVVLERFLKELARFRAEAKALLDHPAKHLGAKLTASGTKRYRIYERFISLRQLIYMYFPRVPQGDWSCPLPSGFLFRTDLRLLRRNAALIAVGLVALLP